jgi:hypothetical protein
MSIWPLFANPAEIAVVGVAITAGQHRDGRYQPDGAPKKVLRFATLRVLMTRTSLHVGANDAEPASFWMHRCFASGCANMEP